MKPPRSATIVGTAVARIVASMATRPVVTMIAIRIGPRSDRKPTPLVSVRVELRVGLLDRFLGVDPRLAVVAHEYAMTGFTVREHRVEVPVDWSAPERFGSIEVFARELVDPEKASDDLPLLLFLQGGPGGQGPRPLGGGWVGAALEKYRVILLDQRGTGRSSPVDGHVISGIDDAAGYLACFRGDAIIADAEHLRSTVYGGRQWATLGQSYGGFLTLTYLSRHPEALTRCFVTGGLPPATVGAEAVYAATFPRQAARNRELGAPAPVRRAAAGRGRGPPGRRFRRPARPGSRSPWNGSSSWGRGSG